MAPWLGTDININDLPIPKLIEVRAKKGHNTDFDKISQELSEIAPYTTTNSHQLWLKKLINFAQSVKILALSVLLTVLTISSFSIFYATKTSLGIHQNIIEILHIMGATDDYIAKQYARRSFFIGLFSGIIGTLLGAAGLWFVSSFATYLKGGIFDKAALDLSAILCISSTPMITAIISMCTAYITVRKTLGKIM
jgi:cell division transport system permease protein